MIAVQDILNNPPSEQLADQVGSDRLLGGALGGRSGSPSPQPAPSRVDLSGEILGGLLGPGRRS